MELPELVDSKLNQRVLVDGYAVSVRIFRLEHEAGWTLELVCEDGTSLCWEEPFEDEKSALDLALWTLEEEGYGVFSGEEETSNVIPFPDRNK